MRTFLSPSFSAFSVLALLAIAGVLSGGACGGSGATGTGGAAAAGPAASSTAASTTSSSSGTIFGTGGGPDCGTAVQPPPPCVATIDEDKDQDGWSIRQGDCNDCDPDINPGAVDLPPQPIAVPGGVCPGIPVDNNCDGKIGDYPQPCDANLDEDDLSAISAAKAAEICKISASATDWGLVSATWVLADGTPLPPTLLDSGTDTDTAVANFHLGHGNLPAFGSNVKPVAGQAMLALSSGTARQPTDPDYQSVAGFQKHYECASPTGFPVESSSCPGVTTGQPNDATAVELKLLAPTNGHGFSFTFSFYTYEWPNYTCTVYNDFFVALLSPAPVGGKNGNISFDGNGDPISVNSAFLSACGCTNGPPCVAGGKSFPCPLGTGPLAQTGFDDQYGAHGATGWLVTVTPTTPKSLLTLRWAVYDSTDGLLDSTTLIDDFQWIGYPVGVGTQPK